jgi:hypothetical protein
LNRCKFEDDGAEFLEALVARANSRTGLAKFTIVGCLPFDVGILVLVLHILKCLSLYHIALETEEACRAVAEAELQYLTFDQCKLEDGGAALIESVRVNRGPKGLGLDKCDDEEDWHPFDSPERFITFTDALRSNSHLERLDLRGFNFREEGILDALAAALLENKGLAHLGLQHGRLDESGFRKLLKAISAHPSLRTLDLKFRDLDMDKTEATKAVVEMLSVNKQLEGIRIEAFSSPFKSSAWAALVSPRLECNVYRKRFPAIQEIRPPSTLAAVLAGALAHVSNKPSLALMLLRENVGILSSYMVEE